MAVSRSIAYFLGSTALLCAVIYHAYQQRYQFYPTVVALTTSKLNVLILCNEALVITLLFGRFCKNVFFGTLREAEVEHLYERSWYAITETCLAMTIFREEFNVRFVALFTALLFIKIFHWLMQDRISYMEQTPAVSIFTHGRMLFLMALLGALDFTFLYYALSLSVQRGPSVLLLFAFECLILTSTVFSTFSKYALYINDMRLGGRWEDKGVYLFYLELVTDLFHMLVYLSFFVLICTYYGLPLHIMRDLYLTCRSFRSRLADFVRYRRITHNMNERFPDATEEELERTDRICIICREHLTTAKKLRCGHLFHFHCLRSWFERQQSCPTCRAPIIPVETAPTINPDAPQEPAQNRVATGDGAAAAGPTAPEAEAASSTAPPPPAALGAGPYAPATNPNGFPHACGATLHAEQRPAFPAMLPVMPQAPGAVPPGATGGAAAVFANQAFPGGQAQAFLGTGHPGMAAPQMGFGMAGMGPMPGMLPMPYASMHPGWMGGMGGAFAPPFVLPPHMQVQPQLTASFLQAQIDWLRQQLAAMKLDSAPPKPGSPTPATEESQPAATPQPSGGGDATDASPAANGGDSEVRRRRLERFESGGSSTAAD